MRESSVLDHIFRSNSILSRAVHIPPGDDMGMIQFGNERLLAAVDQVVEGRHIRLDITPLELIGRKAVTRSLSDIAAMAAVPVATLVAGTLPVEFTEDQANILFDAMRNTAARYDCPLIGGDLVIHRIPHQPLMLSTTVFAQPGPGEPVRRSGAQVGDGIFVTGTLGGSLEPDGTGRHLTFEPRIREALSLKDILNDRLHAMIDLSDGLGRDAAHLARAGGVTIHLQADAIPCPVNLTWERALGDGEDYELCFAASGEVPPAVLGLSLTKVGEVRQRHSADQPWVIIHDGDREISADQYGWEHHS